MNKTRSLFLLIALACTALLATGIYLQEVEYLLPCPLCVIQRMLFWAVGLTALAGFLHNPRVPGQRVYGGLLAVFALGGTGVALHHEWVIRHPEESTCSISPLELFLNDLITARVWPVMFEANGDCADATWPLLGLTIPDWALISFLVLACAAALILWRTRTPG